MQHSRNAPINPLLGVLSLNRRTYCSPDWIETFRDVASRDRTIRLAWAIFELFRGTWVGTLMLVFFGSFSAFRCPLQRARHDQLVTLAIYPNESQALSRLEEIAMPLQCVHTKSSIVNSLRFITSPDLLVRILYGWVSTFRILSRISRHDHFVSLCQSASILLCYRMYLAQLESTRPRGIAISSGSLPQPLALVAAARTLGIPSLFASHASFASNGRARVPPSDAVLMDGTISLESCRRASRRSFVPILWGVSGSCRAISIPRKQLSQLSVGLFLTAPVVMSGVRNLLEALERNLSPARVVLRPHPVAMLTPNLDELVKRFPYIIIERGRPIEDSIARCDLVISGNSNVHREVLRAGVPSLYCTSLDTIAYDYWGFVSKRITVELGDIANFSLEMLTAFYDEAWIERFRAYDATYLESTENARTRVRAEIAEFLTTFQRGVGDLEFKAVEPQMVDRASPRREISGSLLLRLATPADCAVLFNWRTEESVRRNSFNSTEISYEDHSQWYERVMNSPLSRIYILTLNEVPIGQIRFDSEDKVEKLSYSIDKAHRRQGFGKYIVTEGIREIRSIRGDQIKIQAFVKEENVPSLKLLEKVGFVVRHVDPTGARTLEVATSPCPAPP